MEKVVCVSHGQANKVRRAGVVENKVVVIHNAVRSERFEEPSNHERRLLHSLFKQRPEYIIGAAGRLSPEKGFDVLIEAAALMAQDGTFDFGIVLFGAGSLREELQRQIDVNGLSSRFMLAGFTAELDSYLPHFDAFVQSSHTEGLPNVLLEAAAAGVPVVATNVGGTAEVVVDGETGLLVTPGDADALAQGLKRLLCEPELRVSLRQAARQHVLNDFTFAAQASAYKQLFQSLLPGPERVG
jgi:glycosyltransferase involved in cell wall biosynthesis